VVSFFWKAQIFCSTSPSLLDMPLFSQLAFILASSLYRSSARSSDTATSTSPGFQPSVVQYNTT
jgi:hypothetical protein